MPAINQSGPAFVEPQVFVAGAARDAAGVDSSPGAVAVRGGRIVAAGDADHVRRQVGGDAKSIKLPDRLLLPALVNAHAHLQLTAVGPRPFDGSFARWVGMLRQRWADRVAAAAGDELAALGDSMSRGAQASIAAGVLRIGDIASWHVEALDELRRSDLHGVGFIELLGIGGEKLGRTMHRLDELARMSGRASGVTLGLEPHAPYSTGPALYEAATDFAGERGLPLSTHLAEMPEEHRFVRTADGPFRDLLEQLGKWDEAYVAHYRDHRSSEIGRAHV